MESTTQQHSSMPDIQVVSSILAGEKELFEIIIRRYNQRLFRIGMSILNNDATAEDAMQNCYIAAYQHLAAFQNKSSFGTWLTRIMINECLLQKKKAKYVRNKMPSPENTTVMRTPAQALLGKELNAILENAVAELPDKYRLVFVLRELEDLSVKETGEVLGIETVNVKVRLNRAKTMLKNKLSGYIKENVYAFHLLRCDHMVNRVMQCLDAK